MNSTLDNIKAQLARLESIDARIRALRPAFDEQEVQKMALQKKLDDAWEAPGDAMQVGAVIAGLNAGMAVVNTRMAAAKRALEKDKRTYDDAFLHAARPIFQAISEIVAARTAAFRAEVRRKYPDAGRSQADMEFYVRLEGGDRSSCYEARHWISQVSYDSTDEEREDILDVLARGIKECMVVLSIQGGLLPKRAAVADGAPVAVAAGPPGAAADGAPVAVAAGAPVAVATRAPLAVADGEKAVDADGETGAAIMPESLRSRSMKRPEPRPAVAMQAVVAAP